MGDDFGGDNGDGAGAGDGDDFARWPAINDEEFDNAFDMGKSGTHTAGGGGVGAAAQSVVNPFDVVNNTKKEKEESGKSEMLFDEILSLCQSELRKERSTLSEEFEKMIKRNEHSTKTWHKLTKFTYVNHEYENEEMWRQDKCKHGVKATVNAQDLSDISLNSSAWDFDAGREFDYSSYVTDLVGVCMFVMRN